MECDTKRKSRVCKREWNQRRLRKQMDLEALVVSP